MESTVFGGGPGASGRRTVRLAGNGPDTVATNMNVGFLYIPLPLAVPTPLRLARMGRVSCSSRPDLFDDPSASRIHIDQLSFCNGADIGTDRLFQPACELELPEPSMSSSLTRSARKEVLRIVRSRSLEPRYIRVDLSDLFGQRRLRCSGTGTRQYAAIGRRPATVVLRVCTSSMSPGRPRHSCRSRRNKIFSRKRSLHASGSETGSGGLVLHGGTPKTGMSSLTGLFGCQSKDMLAEEGWWYPPRRWCC